MQARRVGRHPSPRQGHCGVDVVPELGTIKFTVISVLMGHVH